MKKPSRRIAPAKAKITLSTPITLSLDREQLIKPFADAKESALITPAIKKLEMTEADLIARGFAESKHMTIEDFTRAALLQLAKTSFLMASRSQTRYAGAYARLVKAGIENPTPQQLASESGGNYRSAKNWIEKRGMK